MIGERQSLFQNGQEMCEAHKRWDKEYSEKQFPPSTNFCYSFKYRQEICQLIIARSNRDKKTKTEESSQLKSNQNGNSGMHIPHVAQQ